MDAPGRLRFEKKIRYLLDVTTSDLKTWRRIAKTHDVQLRCAIFLHSWNEGFDLPADAVAEIGARLWKFGLSAYSAEGDEIVEAFLSDATRKRERATRGRRRGPSPHMGQKNDSMSLHEACYQGRVDVATQLLASGANPNEPADPTTREWVSSAGSRPRPLNCVAIAHAVTENHVEIARLLIEHGAVVDDSVLSDHTIEMVGGPADSALRSILEAARNR